MIPTILARPKKGLSREGMSLYVLGAVGSQNKFIETRQWRGKYSDAIIQQLRSCLLKYALSA